MTPPLQGTHSGLRVRSERRALGMQVPSLFQSWASLLHPEGQGKGRIIAPPLPHSRECSALAAGSAKGAGRPVGHGPRHSPAAPAITGRLWNGENSTSRLPGFSVSDGPALQPCPGTPRHGPGMHTPRQVPASPQDSGCWPEAWPCLWKHPRWNTASPNATARPTDRGPGLCPLGQSLPKLLPVLSTGWACSHCPETSRARAARGKGPSPPSSASMWGR